MKKVLLGLVVIFIVSCGNEKQYFRKSLTKDDKLLLTKTDSLIKPFSGRANWYKQYWTGNLVAKKLSKTYDIKQIGEWRQTSTDGKDLYTIAHFDNYGNFLDEKILELDGTPTVEITCKRDTVNGIVSWTCDSFSKYYTTGKLKSKGKKVMINGQAYKEGLWEYYNESGALEKTIEYKRDKKVKEVKVGETASR